MAIYGQEQINVSNNENQSANSDSLFTAFHKIQNNFTTLFNTASPITNFKAGNGLSANLDTTNNAVTFTNTGVIGIVPGTGVAIANSNGVFTISASGNGNVGVTNVAVTSGSLNVSGSPIISSGSISIELPTIPTSSQFAVGSYVAPNITVDHYGRIIGISNTAGVGTVTSVTVQAGKGIGVSSGTVTSSGTISVTNTGVTSLTAGTGIQLTSSNGDITITSTPSSATVSRVNITSNTLNVTGGPITTSGNINVELPQDFTISGNINLDDLTTSQNVAVGNNLSVVGNATVTGNVTAHNANLGNLVTANFFSGSGNLLSNIAGANVTGFVANAANANVAVKAGTVTTNAQPNITSVGTLANLNVSAKISSFDVVTSNSVTLSNSSTLIFNTVNDNNNKFVALQAPATISSTYIAWSLPNTGGTVGQFLTTDGAGTMKWSTLASSSAPSTASSAGTQGQIAFDATHIYVCIATNSWIRASAAAW